MDVYGGSVRLRIRLTGNLSTAVDYYYYHHRSSNPAALPAGFPADYDRNAVRVGFWPPASREGHLHPADARGWPR